MHSCTMANLSGVHLSTHSAHARTAIRQPYHTFCFARGSAQDWNTTRLRSHSAANSGKRLIAVNPGDTVTSLRDGSESLATNSVFSIEQLRLEGDK